MKRSCFVLMFILSVAVTSFGQATTFYYPHVVNGDLGGGLVWKTTIFLTNPGAAGSGTASGSVTFFKENPANPGAAGSPFSISFLDENNAPVGGSNTLAFQIAPGQTKKYTSTGAGAYATAGAPNGPGGGGYAVVQASSSVKGTAIFSLFSNGKLIGEAGVPAGEGVLKQSIFVDTVGDYKIGVALANVGATAANTVTISLLNTSGVAVSTTTLAGGLGANDHVAKFTFEFFPGHPQMAGTMQIISTSPLSVIALRFDPTFAIFTTLPPVTIASMLEPAVEWFKERPWAQPMMSLARLLGSLQFHRG